MKINSFIKELRFDKRLLDWSLQNGSEALLNKEYQEYLESLQDLSEDKDFILEEKIPTEEATS